MIDQSLVGRKEELGRLRGALSRLEARGSVCLAISGEPGIGKSRLLTELIELSEKAGNLALSGRAAQFEHDVPFAVFVEALDGYLASQNLSRFEPLGGEHLTELARIFPSMAGLAEPGRIVARGERHRAHYAVRALLELLGIARPLVLALDDLQWADEGSLEMVSYLLRRPPLPLTMLALAYRPGETPPRLNLALNDTFRQDRFELVELGPLSESEIQELLADEVGQDTRAWLCRESGGNPFYLEQLRRSVGANQYPAMHEPSILSGEVPAAVAAALAREVAALSAKARRFLEGASVAGDPFPLECALAAAGQSETAGLDALDELLTRQLARPTEVPRRFNFRHPIVRKAVYAGTGDGWRLGAHSRVRDLLQRSGAPATELAHHVERSAAPGDAQAIGILEEAGRMAAALAPGLAAHWLAAAVRLLPEQETARRSAMLVRTSTALGASGRLEESRSVLVEAIRLLPPDAEVKGVHLIALLGALDHLLGRHDEARQEMRSTLAGLADPTSPEAATLQIELAADAIYAADWEAAKTWAELAFTAAEVSGQRALRATADALLCMSYLGLGRIPQAEHHRARAAIDVDELEDAELGRRLGGPYCLGFGEYFMERYEDGVRHLERGIALSRSTGRQHFLTHMKVGQAWCLIQLGRAQEAIELADEAIEAARLVGNLQVLAWGLGIRCWIANVLGDVAVALPVGEEAVMIGAARDESLVSASMRAHFAIACLQAGAYERCMDEMERAGAPVFQDFFSDRKPVWCEVLSQAALGLGRDEEAELWVTRGEAFADGLELPVALAAAQRARARLLLTRGKHEHAVELALAAVEGQESRCARIDAAHTRILTGQALAASGEPARAIVELERAHAEFDRCGAVRPRDEAAHELRRLGRRMPRGGLRGSGAEGIDALSGRERQVAEMIAEGKTNRGIAAALYISEKTVEKHVSRVFAKLGVSGRAAIGAKLAKN